MFAGYKTDPRIQEEGHPVKLWEFVNLLFSNGDSLPVTVYIFDEEGCCDEFSDSYGKSDVSYNGYVLGVYRSDYRMATTFRSEICDMTVVQVHALERNVYAVFATVESS